MNEEIRKSLNELKAMLIALVQGQKQKDHYSTAEVGEFLDRTVYTVREWCRKGQAKAVKSPSGRGWLISHDELTRLRNEGPLPENGRGGL